MEWIAAEDTRVTRALLRRLEIDAPRLISYHDHNERQRVRGLIRRLEAGQDGALVSDAGTPLVADPGYRLVTAAIDAQVEVIGIPGPCAAVVAVSASGLPPDRFMVVGFLPREPGPRRALLEELRFERSTLVFYVAPHRVVDVLVDLTQAYGPARRVALARNLTKTQEQWARGSVGDVLGELRREQELEGAIRGELTLVVEGTREPADRDAERVEALIDALVVAGTPVAQVRDVVSRVFERPRRWVYQRALAARGDDDPEAP